MIATATPPSATADHYPADRYLDLEGARLRYRDEGRGPAVILLHGWTLDLRMWDPQVATLRDEFRLVRFDRRGFGHSQGVPNAGHDASDIAAICRCLGLHRVALIGMSQGARAALRFAASSPGRVCAVILDGPPAIGRSDLEDDVPIASLRMVLRTRGIEAFRREWLGNPLMQLRTADPKMRQLVNAMIAQYPGEDLAADEPAVRAETGAEPVRLGSVPAPTLVLNGAHDLPSRIQAARFLCAKLPAAEHVVIPDAAHLTNLDQPEIYSELCRSFLARHTTTPTY